MAARRLLWALLALAVAASAAELAGVRLPERASVGGSELVLNGAGVRSRAIFKVYVAALYVPTRTSDAGAVLAAPSRRIELHLLRKLSADQLVDALNEGLRDNSTDAELAAVKAEADQLASLMRGLKEVREGNVIAIDYVDGSTRLSLDGKPIGSIPGAAFNRALMRVWVGERPVQSDLKKALLGG